MSDNPYSRHYWRLVDDPKFADVYTNDHHYATWSRLLMIADQAWPATAHIPVSARRASVAKLAEVGLIEILNGGRFRMHGLDAEREKRGHSARNAAAVRWQSERNAEPMPRRDEHRRDEHRRDEKSRDEEAPALAYLASVGATVPPTGNGYHRDLVTLIGRQGAKPVLAALKQRHAAGDRSARQLIYGAANNLEPIHRPSGKPEAKGLGPSVEEAERAFSS